MLDAVEYAVFGLFFLLFAYTVYCSFKYRRQRDADLRGLYQARMNIGMGGALTLLALIWVTVDTLWYLTVVWLIGRVRLVFERPAVRRRIEQISGVVLIGLGVRLATEAR